MNNFSIKTILAVVVAMSTAGPVLAATNSINISNLIPVNKGLAEASFKNVATIQHNIDLAGNILLIPKVGPIATSNVGFGIDKLTVRLPAMEFNPMPMIPVEGTVTQANAQKIANDWMNTTVSAFKQRMGNWIKAKGLSSGIYNFTQEFMMSTGVGPKKKSFLWNISIDKDGKAIYGLPKIIDADPLILDASYVTGSAPKGLPTNWTFQEGGKIKWRILNKKFEPLTTWTYTDVHGVYDSTRAPDKLSGMGKCLIDKRNTGCGVIAEKDINTLMDDTGAAYSFVSYVSALTPEYDTDENGVSTAKGAISVDKRTWNCTGYSNEGYFGYILNATMDRYLVNKTEALAEEHPLGSFLGRLISPVEPYKKTVPASTVPGHPDGYIINPHPGNDELWSKFDTEKMKNVIYVAPVTAGGDGEITGISFSNSDVKVTPITVSGNIKRYYFGTIGDNYWGNGEWTRTVRFTMDNPQQLDQLSIIQAGFDDWFAIWVNKRLMFVGPYGGDRLVYHPAHSYSTICAGHGDNGNDYPCTQYAPATAEWCAGCSRRVELATSWNFGLNIDIRPYMVSGENEIVMKTLVAGGGEGWFVLQAQSCSGGLGLSTQVPTLPEGSSYNGVYNTLQQTQ